MSKAKQIEEMACAMCGNDNICGGVGVEKCIIYPDYRRQANRLYTAGYRKQSNLTPCDVCQFNPPSSGDGKPCFMCPAQMKGGAE